MDPRVLLAYRYAALWLSLVVVVSAGCTTPRALRRSVTMQANTATDIHQQQVLDNLARFVADPYAVPSFAHATAGTDTLTDQSGVSIGARILEGAGGNFLDLGGAAQRTNQAAWSTTPVTDPRKLELMRCAYQRVISQCGCGFESNGCPDCRKRFNQFYTGRAYRDSVEEYSFYYSKAEADPAALQEGESGSPEVIEKPEAEPAGEDAPAKDPEKPISESPGSNSEKAKLVTRGRRSIAMDRDNPGRVANLVSGADEAAALHECRRLESCPDKPRLLDGQDDTPSDEDNPASARTIAREQQLDKRCRCVSVGNGQVNSECLYSTRGCWLSWGCKECVPKGARYVGHHQGTYVWVSTPGGSDELARLTLAILDYAVNDAPSVPRKTVYAFLNSQGRPTTYERAALLVASEVSSDDLSISAVSVDLANADRVESEPDSGGGTEAIDRELRQVVEKEARIALEIRVLTEQRDQALKEQEDSITAETAASLAQLQADLAEVEIKSSDDEQPLTRVEKFQMFGFNGNAVPYTIDPFVAEQDRDRAVGLFDERRRLEAEEKERLAQERKRIEEDTVVKRETLQGELRRLEERRLELLELRREAKERIRFLPPPPRALPTTGSGATGSPNLLRLQQQLNTIGF